MAAKPHTPGPGCCAVTAVIAGVCFIVSAVLLMALALTRSS